MSKIYELYNNGIYENGARCGEIYGNKVSVDGFDNGVTFSEDEQVVGSWIDGRPIYRVCFFNEDGDLKDDLATRFFTDDRHCAYIINIEGIGDMSTYRTPIVKNQIRFFINDETITYNAMSSVSLKWIMIDYLKLS